MLIGRKDHKRTFCFPPKPVVGDRCKSLIHHLIQDKEYRLCSKRYHAKDNFPLGPNRPVDVFGRHVFPDDAEDIKGHRWFRELAWDRLHSTSPPFIPQITSQDDTQYFNESEPLEEFSDSYASAYANPEAVEAALKELPPVMQEMALQLIAEPYDSSKLRQIDFEIETAGLFSRQEQEILKQFVRLYGHKLHKRPRDRILRDRKLRDVVMDVRKTSAFAGYTWRRMRPGGYTAPAQPRFGI